MTTGPQPVGRVPPWPAVKESNTGTRPVCRQCGSPDIPAERVRRMRQLVLSHLRRTQASLCRLCNM
jgi:hypothetical protein